MNPAFSSFQHNDSSNGIAELQPCAVCKQSGRGSPYCRLLKRHKECDWNCSHENCLAFNSRIKSDKKSKTNRKNAMQYVEESKASVVASAHLMSNDEGQVARSTQLADDYLYDSDKYTFEFKIVRICINDDVTLHCVLRGATYNSITKAWESAAVSR
jgi:hypothetical protein